MHHESCNPSSLVLPFIDCCDRLPLREATDEELLRVHHPQLLAAVAALDDGAGSQQLELIREYLAPDMLGNRWDRWLETAELLGLNV